MSDVVNQSYYDPEYHRKYYEKNKQKMIKRAKEKWNSLTEEEKNEYYENRKKQRKLKKGSKNKR